MVRYATVKTTFKNYRFMPILQNGIRNFILSPTVDDRLRQTKQPEALTAPNTASIHSLEILNT